MAGTGADVKPAPRTIVAIDEEIRTERMIWIMERRAGYRSGDTTGATELAMQMIDSLLEERLTVMRRARI